VKRGDLQGEILIFVTIFDKRDKDMTRVWCDSVVRHSNERHSGLGSDGKLKI